MTDHDSLYHRLFADPAMVAQLLRGFAAGPWLDDLDLDRMERQNARFHATTNERRDGDMVWRIPRRGGGDAYLLLLLEFQSRSDRFMALRSLVYTGLLWQQLVKEQRLLADNRLLPVLPIVLYNGEPRWAAPARLHDLIGLPAASPLWPWQPDSRYHVIDEGAFDEADLARREGLVPLLFRLENAADPMRSVALADELLAIFARDPAAASLRALFVELLAGLIEQMAPGVGMPSELLEVRNMLAERMEKWKQRFKEEALEQARQQVGREVRQEGWQQGESALLIRQLERRFGALPGWASERIAAANTDMLETWGLRLLDGGSLDDVLAQ